MALLILAGLQLIPEEIYEAARMDGATTVQTFFRITLPLLKPALMVAILFRTLDALRMYDLPAILTGRRGRACDDARCRSWSSTRSGRASTPPRPCPP